MNKKILMFVIIPVAAIASLGIGFLTATMMAPDKTEDPNEIQAKKEADQVKPEIGTAQSAQANAVDPVQQQKLAQRKMSEQQITELTMNLKDMIAQYKDKLDVLTEKEKGLNQTQDAIKKDLKRLEDTRIEIAKAVNALKKQKQDLEALKISISQKEITNLETLAEFYGKMDAAAASKLIIEKCKPDKDTNLPNSSQIDEVTKILSRMDAKKKAAIFDALIKADIKIAVEITSRLKNIVIE